MPKLTGMQCLKAQNSLWDMNSKLRGTIIPTIVELLCAHPYNTILSSSSRLGEA
jgi:hypothetical protein